MTKTERDSMYETWAPDLTRISEYLDIWKDNLQVGLADLKAINASQNFSTTVAALDMQLKNLLKRISDNLDIFQSESKYQRYECTFLEKEFNDIKARYQTLAARSDDLYNSMMQVYDAHEHFTANFKNNCREEHVDLTQHPTNCVPYGQYNGQAPKMGDAHACLPKILYFALKMGTARLKVNSNQTAQQLYSEIEQICSKFTHEALAQLEWTEEVKTEYLEHLATVVNLFDQIEFNKEAIMLLLGDILNDRNGNDVITFLFFRKIMRSQARAVICLSNHDVDFLRWLSRGMSSPYRMYPSNKAAEILVDAGLTTEEDLLYYFNHFYSPFLVVYYYELDQEGNLHYPSNHAPVGQWETLQMVKGLANYSKQDAYQDLFTEGQLQRLQRASALTFDKNRGLGHAEHRNLMDLINEIFYTNMIKFDKSDLATLIDLGSSDLNGGDPDPYISPFHYVIWNRNSPQPAPAQAAPLVYLNGHDFEDKQRSNGAGYWCHNNITLNDAAGIGPNEMKNQLMRMMLPKEGLAPMPPISLPVAAPVLRPLTPDAGASSSRARDRSPVRSTVRFTGSQTEKPNENAVDENEQQEPANKDRTMTQW